MEKIGNAGWFLSNEEYNDLLNAYDLLRGIFDGKMVNKKKEYENPHTISINENPQEIGINQPYCPYRNPADWLWRPWQAPWYTYGPTDPIPTKYEVGDGEWWKHQPYCTSTTEDNPNTVRDSKTNGNGDADRLCNNIR